ncbi:MAG: LuxR C-terminal-related transcriptional regulator [Clostridiales bacterium]|jgi:hypothetical protein|nr:LuxR C-terminal-related transcriptional regulator [Clostridiales bacterium]
MSEKIKITELQKSVLDCLVRGMTTKEIVAACDCSESSVKQIRANKKLRKWYDSACYEAIRALVPKVIRELERIIDSDSPDSVKIAATKQILEISRIGKDDKDEKKEQVEHVIKVVYI